MTVVYMKANTDFSSYFAQFYLEIKMFLTSVVEKIETKLFMLNTIFRNSYGLDIMWKNGAERGRLQMIIWRMRNSCWIPKATKHIQNMQYLLIFNCNIGCTKVPLSYIISTLPVLFMPVICSMWTYCADAT